jgi:hypothetical protein
MADPQEKNDIIETTLTDAWAIGAALRPVVAFDHGPGNVRLHRSGAYPPCVSAVDEESAHGSDEALGPPGHRW